MIYGTDEKDRARAVSREGLRKDPARMGHERFALECKQCGGDQFHVVVGDYYTAIECPECGWQECVHDG